MNPRTFCSLAKIPVSCGSKFTSLRPTQPHLNPFPSPSPTYQRQHEQPNVSADGRRWQCGGRRPADHGCREERRLLFSWARSLALCSQDRQPSLRGELSWPQYVGMGAFSCSYIGYVLTCCQMQMLMESCPGKTAVSGVMGFALGGAFGLFMASVSSFLIYLHSPPQNISSYPIPSSRH
jgi:hypothetical protein